jgi:hypothetical protein
MEPGGSKTLDRMGRLTAQIIGFRRFLTPPAVAVGFLSAGRGALRQKPPLIVAF